MNKKITSAVHKRIILSMWEDEKKLKDLLDAGVISEEEFNAKKEKLLSEI